MKKSIILPIVLLASIAGLNAKGGAILNMIRKPTNPLEQQMNDAFTDLHSQQKAVGDKFIKVETDKLKPLIDALNHTASNNHLYKVEQDFLKGLAQYLGELPKHMTELHSEGMETMETLHEAIVEHMEAVYQNISSTLNAQNKVLSAAQDVLNLEKKEAEVVRHPSAPARPAKGATSPTAPSKKRR